MPNKITLSKRQRVLLIVVICIVLIRGILFFVPKTEWIITGGCQRPSTNFRTNCVDAVVQFSEYEIVENPGLSESFTATGLSLKVESETLLKVEKIDKCWGDRTPSPFYIPRVPTIIDEGLPEKDAVLVAVSNVGQTKEGAYILSAKGPYETNAYALASEIPKIHGHRRISCKTPLQIIKGFNATKET